MIRWSRNEFVAVKQAFAKNTHKSYGCSWRSGTCCLLRIVAVPGTKPSMNCLHALPPPPTCWPRAAAVHARQEEKSWNIKICQQQLDSPLQRWPCQSRGCTSRPTSPYAQETQKLNGDRSAYLMNNITPTTQRGVGGWNGGMIAFLLLFAHTLHMSKANVTRVESATQWTASVHTLHMSKANVTRVQSATQWTASVHTLHMSKANVTRVQSATEWTASVHTLHMSKANVTRVQSATEWTASVHTLHMSKVNVTRVQSATEWTASVHTLHMSKANVTRVQSATEWTASVHTLHMSKANVTRVQSATQWTASVHTLHMSKANVTRVQRATEWTASVHTLHMSKANVTRVQSATEWTASVHTLHMSKANVTRVQSATEWTASVHTLHMSKANVTRVQSATEWTASVHTLHMSKANVTRVQSATQWTASVHTLHMSKANVTRVQSDLLWPFHWMRFCLTGRPIIKGRGFFDLLIGFHWAVTTIQWETLRRLAGWMFKQHAVSVRFQPWFVINLFKIGWCLWYVFECFLLLLQWRPLIRRAMWWVLSMVGRVRTIVSGNFLAWRPLLRRASCLPLRRRVWINGWTMRIRRWIARSEICWLLLSPCLHRDLVLAVTPLIRAHVRLVFTMGSLVSKILGQILCPPLLLGGRCFLISTHVLLGVVVRSTQIAPYSHEWHRTNHGLVRSVCFVVVCMTSLRADIESVSWVSLFPKAIGIAYQFVCGRKHRMWQIVCSEVPEVLDRDNLQCDQVEKKAQLWIWGICGCLCFGPNTSAVQPAGLFFRKPHNSPTNKLYFFLVRGKLTRGFRKTT